MYVTVCLPTSLSNANLSTIATLLPWGYGLCVVATYKATLMDCTSLANWSEMNHAYSNECSINEYQSIHI